MAHNNIITNINTRISKDSTYNGIQKRLRGKTKHSLSIRCQRNAALRHQLNLQETQYINVGTRNKYDSNYSEWADQRNQGRQQN